ncbi:MAG: right-handed parallel beta-helix repeat-containing protein [Phycisphaeraceae bacterium]|nr:MAG: right-handed parallel beta-helix repeat-containing protein [Phycisphaeraceae bacterium]
MLALAALAAAAGLQPADTLGPALSPSPAREILVADDAALRRALADARPGDAILLAPGKFRGFTADNLRGEPDRPIIVRAQHPADPPVFTSGVHLVRPRHTELADLHSIDAPHNAFNIDDGGNHLTPAQHLTIRRLTIRDNGGRANADGLKLSGVQDVLVEHCTFERWGRGGSAIDMVGCARGVIRDCTFADLESDPASNAVQTKGGSSDITIRRCRFVHAGQRAVNIGGSTGLPYFRPPDAPHEARSITVEGCTFIGSHTPVAFVGVDGAAFRFNTVYLPSRWAARILQESTGPRFVKSRNGRIEDNLFVYRRRDISTMINVGSGTKPETFRFARNYWFATDDPARSIPTLPAAETDPAGGREPRFRDPDRLDLRQTPESPALPHGADALPADPPTIPR